MEIMSGKCFICGDNKTKTIVEVNGLNYCKKHYKILKECERE